MVRGVVHEASLPPLQSAVPEATARSWPAVDRPLDEEQAPWAHAVLAGPGLGLDAETKSRVSRWLEGWRGPTVLDADALNAFAGDEESLGDVLAGRPVIVTPHPLEFARLIGVDLDTVLDERFEIGARLARQASRIAMNLSAVSRSCSRYRDTNNSA